MGLLSFVGQLLGLNNTPNQKIEISKSAAAAGLPIIYGRRQVEAITVFTRASRENGTVSSSTFDHYVYRGDNDRDSLRNYSNWLHRIDVWGQGPITAIDRYWIDGDPHVAPRFDGRRPYFRAGSKYGRAGQTAVTQLSAITSQWGSDHVGNGVAYSWTRFFNSTQYPQYRGNPALKAEIRGLALYDPRKDSSLSFGSGIHRFDNPSTWAYGNNRALVLLNYLMSPYGFGAPKDQLDLKSFAVAADICDQDIDIPAVPVNMTDSTIEDWLHPYTHIRSNVLVGQVIPGLRFFQNTVTNQQKRYEADIAIDPKQGVVGNIGILLEEFGWSLSWSNGRHKLVIEDIVPAPVMTFGERDIISGWSVEHGNRSKRYNRVTVEFPNANKKFENDTVSWPALGSDQHSTYLEEDNGRDTHTHITRTSITDHYRAQAYAEFFVRKSRVGERIKGLRLTSKAMLLEPGDVIAIDYPEIGFDPHKGYLPGDDHDPNFDCFIVEQVNISSDLEVSVDLLRYDATVYGAEPPVPEPVGANDDNPDPWEDPDAINVITAEEYHERKLDGSVVSGIYLEWNPPTANVPVDRIEIKWRQIDDSLLLPIDENTDDEDVMYAGTQYLPKEATAFRIPNLVDDKEYRVSICYVNQLLRRSLEAIEIVNLEGAPDSKLNLIKDGANLTSFEGPYDANTVYQRGDVVTYEGASFIYISPIEDSGNLPTDAVYWELMASAGVSGGFFKNIFRRTNSQPATPTGATPSGWSDGPPPANGQMLWISLALFENDGTFIGPWSTPSEIGGSSVEIQYSSNAISWHNPPFVSTDIYMRQRLSGGSWSNAIRIVGEQGDNGSDGADGSDGQDGEDGATWYSGTNFPSSSLGKVGDFYLRRSNNTVYRKTGTSTWTVDTELTANLGRLADIDFVNTDDIVTEAITKSNYVRDGELRSLSSSDYGTMKEIASIIVNKGNSGSTPFLITAEVTLRLDGGVANVELFLDHDGSNSGVTFIRGDECSNGLPRWITASATVRRFSSQSSSNFKLLMKAQKDTPAAFVRYQHAGLTAAALKR